MYMYYNQPGMIKSHDAKDKLHPLLLHLRKAIPVVKKIGGRALIKTSFKIE